MERNDGKKGLMDGRRKAGRMDGWKKGRKERKDGCMEERKKEWRW
jgi:hypothetical protein